jgi:hypothetical protein
MGPGDACKGEIADGGGADLAMPPPPPGSDLAAPPGSDLATTPSDLAGTPLFTEGFESGTTIPSLWQQVTHNGSLTVDNMHVHRGLWALHVTNNALTFTPPPSPTDYVQADIVETQAVPLPDVYLRAWVYVDTTKGAFDPTNVAIFAVDQPMTPFKGIDLNLEAGSFSSYNNIPMTNVSFTASKTTAPMPTDQWVCLEWRVHSATSGNAKLLVNSTEVTALSGTQNTLPSPALGEIGFGLIAFPPTSTAARDVWFDDIIVDNKAIGCTQ